MKFLKLITYCKVCGKPIFRKHEDESGKIICPRCKNVEKE